MIYFYSHTKSNYKCFSNFYGCKIEDKNGTKYSSSEQYFMAEKARRFDDFETLEKILESDTPSEAKKLGRQVKNFDVDMWDKLRYSIMLDICHLKFSQNKQLGDILRSTGGAKIAEASPRDTI